MAEVEERQFTTLAERIAALNQAQVVQTPTRPPVGKKPPPPIPNARPTLDVRSNTINNPPTSNDDGPKLNVLLPPPQSGKSPIATPPRLPARKAPPPLPTRRAAESPALPARRPSGQAGRRGSTDSTVSVSSSISALSMNPSIASTATTASGVGGRMLPPVYDKASLPPLPPTRRELEEKARLEREKEAQEATAKPPLLPTRSLPIMPHSSSFMPAARPSLPPRLPSRPARSNGEKKETVPALPQRRLPPPVSEAPSLPKRPQRTVTEEITPPPVPRHSRPSEAQIEAVRVQSSPTVAEHCLLCRDFSEPDRVAALYPLTALPPNPSAYLAHVLCDPFPSHTDKARAIFSWMHHNIAYDVDSFFNKTPQSPEAGNTLKRGKAVCGGYAKLYVSIAQQAGLEVIEVVGHGKGYGYSPKSPNEPLPKEDATGHAWNAVRIDNGEWKLIDACWGAGALGPDNLYHKGFTARMFTCSNEDFGLTHFPANKNHFFRSDGSIQTWQQYILSTPGEQVVCSGSVDSEGFDRNSVTPKLKLIPVHSSEMVRFQFSRLCEHWTPEKHGEGLPWMYLLKTHGCDGESGDWLPLEHNDYWWWIDVPANELGRPGQQLCLYFVETIDGESGRGITKDFYLSKKGRVAMGFQSLAMWQLA